MCSISFWTYAWRHSMISIGNADAVRLLWGTNWNFTYYVHKLRATSSVSWLIRSVAGHLPTEDRVRSRMSAGQICGGRSGTLPDLFSQYFGIRCQHLSKIAPYSCTSSSQYNSLSEGQACEVWAPSNKAVLCLISGSTGHKIFLSLFFSSVPWDNCLESY